MTTFSRLALVIQGKIKPCNWIERAFAALAEAASSVLPSISNADRGKFLGVNKTNNNLGWKTIRQVPEYDSDDIGKSLQVVNSGETEVVTETVTVIESQTPVSAGGGEYNLTLGTYDLSEIEVGDTVDVTINGTEKPCEVYTGYDDRKDIRYYTDETKYVTITNDGYVWNEGTAITISTAVISATMDKEVEVPVPAVGWDNADESDIVIAHGAFNNGEFTVTEDYDELVALVENGKVPVLLCAGTQMLTPQNLPNQDNPSFEWSGTCYYTGNSWRCTCLVVTLNKLGESLIDIIEYTINHSN